MLMALILVIRFDSETSQTRVYILNNSKGVFKILSEAVCHSV